MKKILSMALAALLLVGTLGGCSTSGGENGKLVLYTWENMFPQEVLDAFTEETGIAVNYANFDTDETMLAKLQAAEGGDYDLIIADSVPVGVIADASIINRIADMTVFVIRAGRLDRRQLPDIETLFQSRKLHNMAHKKKRKDQNRHGYGYGYGRYGYGYGYYNYG